MPIGTGYSYYCGPDYYTNYCMRTSSSESAPSGGSHRDRLEAGREMAERRRLLDDPVPRHLRRPAGDFGAYLDYVIDMTLRVRSERDRKPDQVHGRRLLGSVEMASEHHRSDLT